MKVNQCTQCDNKTYQKDGICVSCRIGITKMHNELKELMKENTKWDVGLKVHK